MSMAIKKLQNDFTTPEQSKRLLELGVPVDSADCMNFGNADIFQIPFQRPFSEHLELHVQEGLRKMYTPCWSVGRLIEIFRKLCPFGDIIGELIMMNDNIVESFVNEFENPNVEWDFSKLEDQL